MKYAILNPFTPIPKSPKSHVRGWSLMWAQRLSLANSYAHVDIISKFDDLSGYDKIFIDHGANFSGQLNLFGGLSEEIYTNLSCLNALQTPIISLDWSINDIDYVTQIEKRLNAKTTSSQWNQESLFDFDLLFCSMKMQAMRTLPFVKVIMGDSHCQAFSMPNQRIERRNGQTLHGALEMGLIEYIKSNGGPSNELDLCLGSIDIRHHVLRHDICPKAFARRYAEEVIKAQDHFETAINVWGPVPIEHEERKIPGTGQYKGTAFYGSRDQRKAFTLEFINTLHGYVDFDTYTCPYEWYEMDGKEYAEEIMEANSSVHIAPIAYRSVRGWE